MKNFRLFSITVVCCLALACLPAAASKTPLVAVASAMQFAITEIAANFERETGVEVRITHGASGKLYRQIENGAPFELFISADASFTRELEAQGLTRGPDTVIARGRLVVLTRRDSPLRLDRTPKEVLADDRIGRFAIANPVHAPYGQRARQALQSARLWDAFETKLVLGENVAQAAQFALSGTAQAGIVAHSLVLSEALRDRVRFVLLPEAWHQPIVHSMVMLKNADDSTMAFYHYLESGRSRAVLAKHGFTPAP